jgi:hypothetical protein
LFWIGTVVFSLGFFLLQGETYILLFVYDWCLLPMITSSCFGVCLNFVDWMGFCYENECEFAGPFSLRSIFVLQSSSSCG